MLCFPFGEFHRMYKIQQEALPFNGLHCYIKLCIALGVHATRDDPYTLQLSITFSSNDIVSFFQFSFMVVEIFAWPVRVMVAIG